MQGLTVGDGFKFGCGFLLAALIAWVAMAVVVGVLTAIFGAGLTALFGDMVSYVPLLVGVV
jgi:flagellar biosynthesis protein FliQ